MQIIQVKEKYNGKKLSYFLLNYFPNLSQNNLFKALRKKDIRINDIKISENIAVYTNDIVKIYLTDNLLFGNCNIDIIYEDDNIVCANKSANLEVVGDYSLTSLLKKQLNLDFLEPCHRIDRNTTGLVLFAKNEMALEILLEKFKNKEIEKHYLAKVYGIPAKKHDRLEAFLFKDTKKSIVYISDIPKKGYQKIITSYTVISQNKNTCVLDINLETGRTHQIRAHLAHIGCPIIGDGKYGKNEINKLFKKKYSNASKL